MSHRWVLFLASKSDSMEVGATQKGDKPTIDLEKKRELCNRGDYYRLWCCGDPGEEARESGFQKLVAKATSSLGQSSQEIMRRGFVD